MKAFSPNSRQNPLSLYACWICAVAIVGSAFFLYPRWKKDGPEKPIGWDVSGYYLYLPAAFIYHDLREVAFLPSVIEKYHPTPSPSQGFQHPSGAYVMKYSAGQALQFLPWFMLAHGLARPLSYPADGFSLPYQVAIGWGSLLIALLGLWFARRNLLTYFSDRTAAATLLALTLGSNYLNYTAFDGAMTHNWLFTAYSLLIFSTIQFYRLPSFGWAAVIGGLIGWMTLTRPTELVAVLLPLLWGIESARTRLFFFKTHFTKIMLAGLVGGAFLFLQLAYWKWAAGEWLVYSYENQGFSWYHPHVLDVVFSYRAGWLMYSPIMALAIAGLCFLWWKKRGLFWPVALFSLVNLYVVSAWDIWWYGGSLGMRALVQSYAVWIFPLAAFADWVLARRWRQAIFGLLSLLCFWHNLWWTWQAHAPNGLFVSEQMNGPYFRHVLWRLPSQRQDDQALNLLDSPEQFCGRERRQVREIYANNFENDTLGVTTTAPLAGNKSLILSKEKQNTPEFFVPLAGTSGWLRTSVTFRCHDKEWNIWHMTLAVVRIYSGPQKVKENIVRLQRHVKGEEVKRMWFDTQLPDVPFDHASVFFWNGDGDKTLWLDDLQVEVFE